MKRKDLYNYIKEEIVATLSETTYAGAGAVDKIQKDPKFNTLKSDAKTNAIGDLKKGGDVELEEMANIASTLKIQDPDKFALAKEIYTGGRTAAVLSAIEEAGDEGTTQKQLGSALGIKNDSDLNPIISNLRAAGVITGKREKPTPTEVPPSEEEVDDEWENEEETTDDWENAEEETPKEEPIIAPPKTSDDDLGKWVDELAKLNTKKDDLLKKLKSKEITMDQYKETIGNLPSQIKTLQAKIDQYSG